MLDKDAKVILWYSKDEIITDIALPHCFKVIRKKNIHLVFNASERKPLATNFGRIMLTYLSVLLKNIKVNSLRSKHENLQEQYLIPSAEKIWIAGAAFFKFLSGFYQHFSLHSIPQSIQLTDSEKLTWDKSRTIIIDNYRYTWINEAAMHGVKFLKQPCHKEEYKAIHCFYHMKIIDIQ